jgi:hypothetical protein
MLDHYTAIIAEADAKAANAALEAVGMGPENFTAQLVGNASQKNAAATHRWAGFHHSYFAEASAALAKAGVACEWHKGDLDRPGDWKQPAMEAAGLKTREEKANV